MVAFAMARAYEARLDDNPSLSNNWPCTSTPSPTPQTQALHTPSHQASPSNPKPNALPPLLPTPQTQIPVRQLPPAEIHDRRRGFVLSVMKNGTLLIMVSCCCYSVLTMTTLTPPLNTQLQRMLPVTFRASTPCPANFRVDHYGSQVHMVIIASKL